MIHTLKVLAGGFLLLVVCLAASHALGGAPSVVVGRAAKVFIPLWLVAAAFNMWFGVAKAGYSVSDEAPIFLMVFAIPSAVAALLWWWVSRT